MARTKKPSIQTSSLVDQVYEYLLEKIIFNELSYGDRLSIKELSEALGISTMPVRDAIKRLEYDRVVEVKPRSSCSIRVPDKKETTAVYELREALELFAIRKFLDNFDPSRLTALEQITKKMKQVSSIRNPENRAKEAMRLDQQFHTELCRLGDNEYLCYYHRQLSLHFNMAAIHAKSYHQLEDKHFKSHSDIVSRLKANSPEAMESLIRHFDNVWNVIT
jgi:GntR family transcriptional regulator, rspAB operon transcriptional repressor